MAVPPWQIEGDVIVILAEIPLDIVVLILIHLPQTRSDERKGRATRQLTRLAGAAPPELVRGSCPAVLSPASAPCRSRLLVHVGQAALPHAGRAGQAAPRRPAAPHRPTALHRAPTRWARRERWAGFDAAAP